MEFDNNERLRNCFRDEGRKYGYDNVSAEFLDFKDMKIRWQRTYGWADFRVSDYLRDAPDEVLRSTARSLFRRILGIEDRYSPELMEWVTLPEFHQRNRETYLDRCRNITRTTTGRCKSLDEAYDRLIGAGLVPYDPTITFSWSKDPYTRRAGSCSVLMRVVAISSALDTDDVPDFVLDYCLYHELCHILVGFDPMGDAHEADFYALENKFPSKREAETWLRRICVFA
ncbi:MAG: hypothetical protein MJZ38_00205 [archaeon]|nr:hypothetical protein [archaeon]